LDMLKNKKMIMTGSTLYDVGKLKELDREDARKTCWDYDEHGMKSLGLSQKMDSLGKKVERELRGQLANPGSPGKMAVKQCVCHLSTSRLFSVKTLLYYYS